MRAAGASGAWSSPLNTALDDLRNYLQAQPVTLETLPPEIAQRVGHAGRRAAGRSAAEGRSERQRDAAPVRARGAGGRAGRHRRPDLRSSNPAHTVIRAFFEAGFWALLSIAILLWIVLRRFGDVLLTLIPLLSPAS